MKRLKTMLTCMLILFAVTSCSTSKDNRELALVIGPETVMRPYGANEKLTEFMVVTRCNGRVMYLFPDEIDGFHYEKGYEYRIIAKQTIEDEDLVDDHSTGFYLIKILYKKKVDTSKPNPKPDEGSDVEIETEVEDEEVIDI